MCWALWPWKCSGRGDRISLVSRLEGTSEIKLVQLPPSTWEAAIFPLIPQLVSGTTRNPSLLTHNQNYFNCQTVRCSTINISLPWTSSITDPSNSLSLATEGKASHPTLGRAVDTRTCQSIFSPAISSFLQFSEKGKWRYGRGCATTMKLHPSGLGREPGSSGSLSTPSNYYMGLLQSLTLSEFILLAPSTVNWKLPRTVMPVEVKRETIPSPIFLGNSKAQKN